MTTFINETVAREQITTLIGLAEQDRVRRELRRARRDARRQARQEARAAREQAQQQARLARALASTNVTNWPHQVGYVGGR